MSRADGILSVVLAGKWYDMIASGEKREEYRGAHWGRRLLTTAGRNLAYVHGMSRLEPHHFHRYHTLIAHRGCTHCFLTRNIKCIRWGEPRPEWSDDTVRGECFIIELEGQ